MMAYDFAGGGDKLARSIGHLLALLIEISVNEALVVAARDEAYLLRIGLYGDGKLVLTGDFADFWLGVSAEREECTRELLLGKAEKKIGLVLAQVCGALQDPAVADGVILIAGIVAGGDAVGANLARADEKLVELEVVIAERAGNGCASGEVLGDKGPDHVALKALLLIDEVVGDAQSF